MRGVRQAVSRCERAGLRRPATASRTSTTRCLAIVRERADQWRDGEVERGFSMALGRFGERADGRSVVALCRDADGVLRGLLHFVPWGSDGLSLDLMRRDRDCRERPRRAHGRGADGPDDRARRDVGCR